MPHYNGELFILFWQKTKFEINSVVRDLQWGSHRHHSKHLNRKRWAGWAKISNKRATNIKKQKNNNKTYARPTRKNCITITKLINSQLYI